MMLCHFRPCVLLLSLVKHAPSLVKSATNHADDLYKDRAVEDLPYRRSFYGLSALIGLCGLLCRSYVPCHNIIDRSNMV